MRGFFTGGTLCYEAQVVLSESLGPVYSNIPLRPDLGLPAPAGAHVCLDLGEEEYTKGRPHPMIDPAARKDIMQTQAFGTDIAAVLLDVVIGYGSHPDPAGEIAGTCADILASGAAVVCYVLGARADRQGLDRQRAVLTEAGAIVTASAAQAARVAAAVAVAARGPAGPPRCARDGCAGAGRPGDLLGQAARRGGPHRAPGRDAARGRVPGAGHRARRSGAGFFRPVRAPVTIIPAPPALPTLEERVFASVAALAGGLRALSADYPILHTQDCISARAACRSGIAPQGQAPAAPAVPPVVIRTVHHVDDFTSPSLIDCQRRAILEPDRILVVSEHWREMLADEYGTPPPSCTTGSTSAVSRRPTPAWPLRYDGGRGDSRPLILSVGGIEPRKGSDTLMRAMAALRRSGRNPVLTVVGGHSFQDYREYRDQVLSSLPQLGLRLDDDVVLLGTVPDAQLPGWYAAADVLAFPSTKEGWGLAVLEAMSAGLPVVASDLPVFHEYLRPGQDALMVPVNDAVALAAALSTVLEDQHLADRLRSAVALCTRFTWTSTAAEHQEIYAATSAVARSSKSA